VIQVPDATVYPDDRVDAAVKATEFVHGLSCEEFARDDRTVFALVRATEIVGEAAKHLPPIVRDQASEIPWADMAGMRDQLIHGYQGVDLRVLWRTVRDDRPFAIDSIRSLRQRIEQPD